MLTPSFVQFFSLAEFNIEFLPNSIECAVLRPVYTGHGCSASCLTAGRFEWHRGERLHFPVLPTLAMMSALHKGYERTGSFMGQRHPGRETRIVGGKSPRHSKCLQAGCERKRC
jgi:hypothetical protein